MLLPLAIRCTAATLLVAIYFLPLDHELRHLVLMTSSAVIRGWSSRRDFLPDCLRSRPSIRKNKQTDEENEHLYKRAV